MGKGIVEVLLSNGKTSPILLQYHSLVAVWMCTQHAACRDCQGEIGGRQSELSAALINSLLSSDPHTSTTAELIDGQSVIT